MRKLVDNLNLFVAILAAGTLVVMYFDPSWWQNLQKMLSGFSGIILIAIAAAIIAGNIYAVIQEIRDADDGRRIHITVESGENAISVGSLEELLCDAVRNESDVVDPRVCLSLLSSNRIRASLTMKLIIQNDVPARMEVLRKKMMEQFMKLFPNGIEMEILATVSDLLKEQKLIAS